MVEKILNKEQQSAKEHKRKNNSSEKSEKQPADISLAKKTAHRKPRKEMAKLKKKIIEFEQELEKSRDRYLRFAAEFDNYRKRTRKEFQQLIESAEEKLIFELLPVLDNLERVNSQDHSELAVKEFIDGIKIITNQFSEVLKKAGVEPFESVGKEFEPNLHDAMMQVDGDGAEPNVIVQEIEKGYMIGSKVLRHAKVSVAK